MNKSFDSLKLNKREKAKQITLEVISAVFPDHDLNKIDSHAWLREHIGLDSMSLLNISLELRKRYGIDVCEGDYCQFATLSSSINYVYSKI